MANFKQDILDALKGEEVEAIVIYNHPEHRFDDDKNPLNNKVLKWGDVEKELDYKYHSGYGGQECHDIFIWTETRIITVHEYDGSTCLISVPRNPKNYGQ